MRKWENGRKSVQNPPTRAKREAFQEHKRQQWIEKERESKRTRRQCSTTTTTTWTTVFTAAKDWKSDQALAAAIAPATLSKFSLFFSFNLFPSLCTKAHRTRERKERRGRRRQLRRSSASGAQSKEREASKQASNTTKATVLLIHQGKKKE